MSSKFVLTTLSTLFLTTFSTTPTITIISSANATSPSIMLNSDKWRRLRPISALQEGKIHISQNAKGHSNLKAYLMSSNNFRQIFMSQPFSASFKIIFVILQNFDSTLDPNHWISLILSQSNFIGIITTTLVRYWNKNHKTGTVLE